PVQEISFYDMVNEHESAGLPVSIKKDTFVAPVPRPLAAASRADSLTLEAVAAESVWVHLVIDGKDTREYMLSPSHHLRWTAGSSFLISLGNADGISFTLNGQKLGSLGKGNSPVKNTLL